MKQGPILILSVILYLFNSCFTRDGNPNDIVQRKVSKEHFLINLQGDTITTLTPTLLTGSSMDRDSLEIPRKTGILRTPKQESINENVIQAGTPNKVDVPDRLHIVIPGENGVPPPKTVPAHGKTIAITRSPSRPALPALISQEAKYDIQQLDVEQGVKASFVWDIMEDSRGHIWFGTGTNGVVEYNGQGFTMYSTREGLSSNTLRDMMEDSKGNLWFATDGGGVCKYDGHTFTHYSKEGGLLDNVVYSLLEDSHGNIWIGTLAGLNRFDGSSFTHFTKEEGLSGNTIKKLFQDSRENIWIGTIGAGVSRYAVSAENGLGSFTHFTTREGLSHNIVRDIWEDEHGVLWFATSGGICHFNGTQFTQYAVGEGLSDNVVWSICEDQWGDLWFGTTRGLNKFERDEQGARFIHYTVEEGLSNDWILSMLEDGQGNLWVGTRGGGINRFDTKSFSYIKPDPGLEKIWIRSLLADRSGDLWLGTEGQGLLKFDGSSFTAFTTEQGLHHNNVSSLQQDKLGNLWIGMFGRGGIDCFDGQTFTHYGVNQGLNNSNIWSMLIDREDHLWCGTWFAGMSRFNIAEDGGDFTHFTKEHGLSSNNILEIMEDSKGNIWFGTRGSGISRYDGQYLVNFSTEEGMGVKGVTVMMEDSHGYLWFGGNGLSRYNPQNEWNHFVSFSEEDGLSDNRISSIIEDNSQNIWVSTQSGISLLKPLPSQSLQQDISYDIYRFGAEDGLKNLNFSQGDVCLDRSDRLWWGAVNGLTMLDLNRFQESRDTPNIWLNTIAINDNYIDYRRLKELQYKEGISNGHALLETSDFVEPFFNYPGKLVLPAQCDHLTFHFYAIDWTAPHKLQYSFMIDGLDEYWSTPRSETKADYRNLPHGAYKFRVKAIGESKIWSQSFEYDFEILPPWWLTWWSKMLYIASGAFLISGYIRWRTHRLRRRQRELEQTVTERTAEIVAEKERSEELLLNILPSETAQELKEHGSAKARNYDMVTVIFTDFKDFTKHAEVLPPEELVDRIDYCFKAFDQIMEDHSVEKIKTIGDAYMAAAGLPTPNSSNPVDAVNAALAIRDFMSQHQAAAKARGEQTFEMRIGIHSGPVVAGIVGIKKFAYDIWGDTVNLAARMESSGETGRVNISQSTYDLIKDYPGYSFEPRGKVEAKNKGELEMYFVEPICF